MSQDSVYKILKEEGKPMTCKQIRKKLKGTTVSKSLMKLARNGEIKKELRVEKRKIKVMWFGKVYYRNNNQKVSYYSIPEVIRD